MSADAVDSAVDVDAALSRVREGTRPVLDLIAGSPDGEVPVFSFMTGGYVSTRRYSPDSWADFPWAGFLAGRLWLLEDLYPGEGFGVGARRLCDVIGHRLSSAASKFSAAGIDVFYALCLGARVTGDPALVETALAAVRRYAENFDERLGVFFQVVGVNRAVIDTGLNLLPFYWAGAYASDLPDYATAHNRTLLRDGIIRPDGSSNQAIEYDLNSGEPRRRFTLQGWSSESTWARGQAWAVHNYTNAYEATGDKDFLEVARKAAGWYLEHLPSDLVPFYDFDDPAIPSVPKDACAAAITLNGLMRLARLDASSNGWAQSAADRILAALLRDYLSPGGVLLHGSWGRLPAEKAGAGYTRFPQEDVMPYGNYWITEALWRSARDDWSLLAHDGSWERGGRSDSPRR